MGMMLVTKAERTESDSLSSLQVSSVTFAFSVKYNKSLPRLILRAYPLCVLLGAL